MNLFTPLKIKNITLKNRIVLPPMVRFSMLSNNSLVNDDLLEYYEKLAKDGNGLIIVEATCVSSDGKLRDNQLGIWKDKFIDGLSKVADICHKYDVPVIIQLHHAGFVDNLTEVPTETLDKILDDFVDLVQELLHSYLFLIYGFQFHYLLFQPKKPLRKLLHLGLL